MAQRANQTQGERPASMVPVRVAVEVAIATLACIIAAISLFVSMKANDLATESNTQAEKAIHQSEIANEQSGKALDVLLAREIPAIIVSVQDLDLSNITADIVIQNASQTALSSAKIFIYAYELVHSEGHINNVSSMISKEVHSAIERQQNDQALKYKQVITYLQNIDWNGHIERWSDDRQDYEVRWANNEDQMREDLLISPREVVTRTALIYIEENINIPGTGDVVAGLGFQCCRTQFENPRGLAGRVMIIFPRSHSLAPITSLLVLKHLDCILRRSWSTLIRFSTKITPSSLSLTDFQEEIWRHCAGPFTLNEKKVSALRYQNRYQSESIRRKPSPVNTGRA